MSRPGRIEISTLRCHVAVTYDSAPGRSMLEAPMSRSVAYPLLGCAVGRGAASMFGEGTPTEPPKPRLLDRVRATLRLRHYSRRTEQAYVAWIRRYIVKLISLCASSLSARNREGAVVTGITARATTTHPTVL